MREKEDARKRRKRRKRGKVWEESDGGTDLRFSHDLPQESHGENRRGAELGLHEHGEHTGVEVTERYILERLLQVVHACTRRGAARHGTTRSIVQWGG